MAIAVFVGTVLKLKRSKLDSIEAGLAAVAEAVVEAVVAELCVVLTSFSLFEAATEVVIVTVEFVFFVISFGLCLSLKENKNISLNIFIYSGQTYVLDVLCRQPIKLFHVVSTSEFHEY